MFVILAAFAVVFASCSTAPKEGEEAAATEKKVGKSIKSESDTLSYAVGVDLGTYLQNLKKSAGEVLNLKYVIAAINDIAKGKGTLDQEEAVNFLQEYFSVRIPAKKLAESQAFLAEVEKNNPNVKKTESGLLYEVIAEGSEKKATDTKDKVRVMYKGMLKDGTVFDSSYERGDTAEFALQNVIKGWGEGLQLVGEGGKIKLWIPSELGYGAYGAGQMIGPNEALVFEVELFEVIPAPAEEKK